MVELALLTSGATQQIVGRERRERVSQLAWCGEGCFDSRRRVNSTVRRLLMNISRTKIIIVIGSTLLLTSCQQSLAMWVIPGSTADNLVFGWSRSRDSDEKVQPEEIRIFPCN